MKASARAPRPVTVSPRCDHTPHKVFKAWGGRYTGVFDLDYDKYREIVLEHVLTKSRTSQYIAGGSYPVLVKLEITRPMRRKMRQ